jgi:hypothetical protein
MKKDCFLEGSHEKETSASEPNYDRPEPYQAHPGECRKGC